MQEAVAAGVVTEVEEAVEWLAPAHMVEKPGQPGKLRLVTDFRRLSDKVVKDVHRYPNGKDVWQTVGVDSNVFFKLDATQSYHQVKLSNESKRYMNFILPIGKFIYKSAAMGFVNSGSEWNRRRDKILKGAPWVKHVDDIMGKDYKHLAADLKRDIGKVLCG